MQETAEFVPIKGLEGEFDILNVWPFTIRKTSNHRIVKEYKNNCGYFMLRLGKKQYLKHKIIAKQFIPNPDRLPFVDHINKNREDNRIENLRWVSSSDNSRNRTVYNGVKPTYIEKIPEEAIKIENYEMKDGTIRTFPEDRYYWWVNPETEEHFFYARITDNLFKVLYQNTASNGDKLISMLDVNRKLVSVLLKRFLKQRDF